MNIPENFDRWMFDYLEGNLSRTESEELERFIAENPSYEMDAEAWQGSKITANDFVYPNEHLLRKKRRFVGWYAWSTAAVVAILVGTITVLMMDTGAQQIARYSERNETQLNNSRQFDFYTNNTAKFDKLEKELEAVERNKRANNSRLLTTTTALPNAVKNNTKYKGNSSVKTTGNSVNYSEEGEMYNGYALSAQHVNLQSLEQAKSKLQTEESQSKYQNNPALSVLPFDMKVRSKTAHTTLTSQIKKMYRKIERMVDYPVGLINLRDPEIILPENNLLSFNPAFVGGMLRARVELNYRNQWLGDAQNSQISSVSFDTYSHQLKGGVGMQLKSEIFGNGAFSNQSIDLFYSPKVSISKNVVFEPALKLTMGTLIGDPNKIGSNSVYELQRGNALQSPDLTAVSSVTSIWYKDIGAGFVLNTKWFYLGFSADNLSRHYANIYSMEGQISPQKSPLHYTAIAGSDWENERKTISISPFVSYRNFGKNSEGWIGLNYRMNYFQIGGSYSTNNDFTLATGIKFDKFKLVYHYDRTQPVFASEKMASHNISIRFNGNLKNARFKK